MNTSPLNEPARVGDVARVFWLLLTAIVFLFVSSVSLILFIIGQPMPAGLVFIMAIGIGVIIVRKANAIADTMRDGK